jgi:hypothetical protein
MPSAYSIALPATAGATTHPTSGWAALVIVIAYLAGEAAFVALSVWYGIRAGADHRERTLRHLSRRHPGLVDELRSLDESLTRLWADEVEEGRRRAGRDARRLISGEIPLVDVQVRVRRADQSCTQLTFADGTVLFLWSSGSGCARELRHLPANAVIQYVPHDGCDSVVLGTDSTSVVLNGALLALAA